MAAGMRLKGQKALERTLKTLPEVIQGNVASKAVSKAWTPMKQAVKTEIKAQAFDDSLGAMDKSIKKKTKAYKATWSNVAIVGPDKNFTMPDDNAFGLRRPANYLHLLILGHFGRWGDWVQPFDFLTPAYRKTIGVALVIYRRTLASGIKRRAKDARRRSRTR